MHTYTAAQNAHSSTDDAPTAELSSHGECSNVNEHTLSSDSNYASFLKTRYKPNTEDGYVDGDFTWPPPVTDEFKVFNLAMIKVKKIPRRNDDSRIEYIKKFSKGDLDQILKIKSPDVLELERVSKDFKHIEQRKVLILGGPGSGKSTLSLHICQEWRKGKLFQDYNLVILVKLRETNVQNATNIAEMIPRVDDEMGREAQEEITACKGRGVLFIIDGWDELPQNASCRPVIKDILEHSESSIIITSRPISSLDLHTDSRIEILGFTHDELQKFFAYCLDNKTEDVKALLQKIKENPRVAGSCHLPLNASILVHLFKCNGSLPSTEYGIFYDLICNCIVRDHKKKRNSDIEVESLDKLPDDVQKSFNHLCEVAYDGVKKEKIIFDRADLGTSFNSLGLLQGEQSFSAHGTSQLYHFVHLSVQEILTAFHMANKLSETEQVEQFKNIFTQPRFYAVIRYFAAITKLKNSGIKEVVSQVAKKQLRTVAKDKSTDSMFGYTYQSELVTLFHCLFEAQDDDLCEGVVRQLNSKLDLGGTSLGPTDCLSLGYFLTYCKHCAVSLLSCSIGDEGCKMLFSQRKGYPFRTLKYVIIFTTVLTCACACVNVLGAAGYSHKFNQSLALALCYNHTRKAQ